MGRKKNDGVNEMSLLMNSIETAKLLGCTVKTLLRWHAYGQVPVPVTILRRHYWKREEILRWIDANCPSRQDWKKMNIKY